jgi:hypothetical protein
MKAEGSVSANLGLILVCLGVGLYVYLRQAKRKKYRISDIDKLLSAAPVMDTVQRITFKSLLVKEGLLEKEYLPGEEWFNRHDSR